MTTAAPSTAPATPTVRDTPLQQMSMTAAKEAILLNLFRRFQGTRPDLEERLQDAYKTKYGRAMRMQSHRDVRAAYLEGEPGHGKTTTHQEACREFSKLTRMKFLVDPSLSQMQRNIIDSNTFVFSTMTVAGATSKHEVGGLMAKMKINDHEFMGHLPDWKMAATMMGGYGYILFDDFVTSSNQVQNACLDLLLGGSAGDFQFSSKEIAASTIKVVGGQVINGEKTERLMVLEHDQDKADAIEKMNPGETFHGASPVHVGLAGNRGSRDGNKVFPLTTAIATRIQRMDVVDTLEEWLKRANTRYADEVGDAHYSIFLKSHPELFSAIGKPINGILPSMPCPRTHDACMDAIGTLVHNAGGFGALIDDEVLRNRFIDEVEQQAGAHIGVQLDIVNKTTGNQEVLLPSTVLSGFYTELLLGALPRADEIINKGVVNVEFITKHYNGGNDSNGQNFGFQFASSLATLAASVVGEKVRTFGDEEKSLEAMSNKDSELSLDVRETMRNFSYGLTFLSKPMVSQSIDKFLNRLSTVAPVLFEGSGPYKVPNQEIMGTFLYGMIKDNTKFPTTNLRTTYVDSMSTATNGYLDGIDHTIEEALKKRKDMLNNMLKLGLK